MNKCSQAYINDKCLSVCLIYGNSLFVNERLPLQKSRILRHRDCSKQRLILQLREQAHSLGLTSLELLTRRVVELEHRILQALGEVGFEQLQTAEPAGYLHLFLSGSDLKVRVVFSRRAHAEAMYLEALMTPGELQQQKARLLRRINEQASTRTELIHTGSPGGLLVDWLMVADWLRHGEDHWNGHKKQEIAGALFGTERVQLKILSSTGMDLELASRPLVPNCSKLKAIAKQILSAESPEDHVQVERARGEVAEVV